MATGPGQPLAKPLGKIHLIYFTACDVRDCICNYFVVFNELIAAPLNKQFHQIQGRSLFPVCKSMI